MLFHSSIRKELARSFGATLVVLVTIVMTMMLIRTLGQASRGSVNPSDVMVVMAYTVLGHLPTILTLSLFIAIVGTLSRMYRDSEMVIWFASGRGLASFLGPLFRFAWPVLLVIALLALVVWPWSNQQTQDMKDRFEKRGDLERIAPGQFQESASGSRVFFIEKESPNNKTGQNVFISATERGKEAVTSARSGRVEIIGEDNFLLLSIGQRLESTIGETDLKISDFAEYGTKVGADSLGAQEDAPAKSLSTLALLMAPTRFNLGELAWRIGLALAAMNFVVIAVAVSSVNPRAGRGGSMIFALFSFVVYYNLLNLGQSWIGAGRISFSGFLLALHGGVLALGLLWLGKRHNNWFLRRPARQPVASEAGA
ncbi:LPS export ABC transporter permease LptF [Variovorax terrae]|uniref:Lipopolysaccharide export system permease protein LptF n=1 Tax=Variovorax terrae TaxID=2923278 RepID=A0A9X1VW77_9BURK|nr:LPS export ABC transporter permease LptF [Variovorax terrae]MCJ0763184.1 LPS export ABC transporter permease LptF [Variovorax terrae]